MKAVLDFFVRKHLLASLVSVIVFVLGAISFQTINKDLYPRVKMNEIFITTPFPGASPEDVEQNVTCRIEKELKSVVGIERFTSLSMEDLSLITIQISDELSEKGVTETITMIRDAVSRVSDLPEGVEGIPKIEQINTGLIPIISVGVHSDIGYDSLRTIAKWVQKEFEQLPGIAKVNTTGIRDKEVKIEIDPRKMERWAISSDEIIQILQARAVNNSIGFTRSRSEQQSVVMREIFREERKMKNLIVRTSFDGPAIRLGSVAELVDTFADQHSEVRINGKEVIHFSILKKEDADIIASVESVKTKIKELEEICDGIEFETASDMSRYVTTSFEVVRNNGIIGFILVFIILAIFLNPRVAFWVAMGIPISLLGVVFLLPYFNVTLDVITLASMILVIGIIVDDAIVISESIYQRWESGEPPLTAAVNGIADVFWPVVTAVISTLLAFIPMFLIPGDMGKFIFVIPLTVSLALTISLVEGVVALPSHIATGLEKKNQNSKSESFLYHKVKSLFQRLLRRVLKVRYFMVALFVSVLIGTLILAFTHMKLNMFPSEGAEEFAVYLETPQGTSLKESSLKAKEVEKIIAAFPREEISSYTTTVGDAAAGRSGNNQIAVNIDLTPFSSRKRNANMISDDLRERLKSLRGFTNIMVDVTESGPNSEKAISLQVVGDNDSLRIALAERITSSLGEVAGVFDINNNQKEMRDEIVIAVRQEKLPRYHLTEAELFQYMRTALNGEIVAKKQSGNDQIKYRVIFPLKYQTNPKLLLNTRIMNRNQRQIELGKLISVEKRLNSTEFPHYNGQRSIYIEASTDKEKVSSFQVVTDILNKIDISRDYPGIQVVIGGSAKASQESTEDLVKTFLLAAIGIYILLVLLFDSLIQPFLVLAAIPFGIVGIILVFLLHNEPMSFMAALGIIGLSGVVVNDSLVLVEHLNKLLRERGDKSVWTTIAEGTANRLRAILLTTITTVGGILPLAYGIGGADPMNAPMALSLGWGLLFATPLTLILVPCLYGIYVDMNLLMKKLKSFR